MRFLKITFVILAAQHISFGSTGWESRIPNGEYARIGQKTRCQLCHEYSAPDVSTANFLNAFGADFKTAGNHWGQSLANKDSDGDNWNNEVELNCKNNYTWSFGPCGSDLGNVYSPGDPDITPGIGIQKIPAGASGVRLSAEPNPFRGTTTFVYALSVPGKGMLKIFDGRGRRVSAFSLTGVSGRVFWSGVDAEGHKLPAGLYVAALTAGSLSLREKIVLTR